MRPPSGREDRRPPEVLPLQLVYSPVFLGDAPIIERGPGKKVGDLLD